MSCLHLIAFRSENGKYHCRDCGVGLAVVRHDPGFTLYQQAVSRVLRVSRAFVEAPRDKYPLLYLRALHELEDAVRGLREATRGLEEWGIDDSNDRGARQHGHISLAEAQRAAEALAYDAGLTLSGSLIDGDLARDRCVRPAYNAPPEFPAGWFVGYTISDAPLLLPAQVLGVLKATGEARILGHAEGTG